MYSLKIKGKAQILAQEKRKSDFQISHAGDITDRAIKRNNTPYRVL